MEAFRRALYELERKHETMKSQYHMYDLFLLDLIMLYAVTFAYVMGRMLTQLLKLSFT